MKINIVLISLALFAVFLFQGCDNSKLAKIEKELAETKQLVMETNAELLRTEQKMNISLSKVEKLTIANRQLESQKLKYENLLSDEDELKRLISRYNTAKKQIIKFNEEAQKHNQPEIILDRIISGTIFIQISDSEMLTQRMGSYGADAYMKETIETLASINGIDCVNFDFEEGDHALPGKFCK